MKSPLVEALRQASGRNSSSTQAEPASDDTAAAESVDAATAEQAADSRELQLMESTGVLPSDGPETLPIDGPGILPIDGPGILPIDGPGILPIDGPGILPIDGPSNAAGEELDAEFYETSTLQVANDDSSAAATTAGQFTDSAPYPPAAHSGRRTGMPRLGLYSPLVCLALTVVAGGAHVVYQNIAGWYQNSDLASLSSQIGSPAGNELPGVAESDSAINRFELIAGPQSSVQSDVATDSNVKAATAATVGPSATRVIAPVTSGNGYDDAAFAAINAAYQAYEQGDYVAAETGYRRALELAPKHPNALHGLAAILHKTGRLDESLQHYEMLLAVDPHNMTAAVALLAGRDDSSRSAGESEIKQLIQRHPDSARLQFALGTLLAQQSRWPAARVAFDKALRIDNANADYLFNLAVTLEHLGQYIDARFYYESALDAANATSTVNSEVVAARIERLALLSDVENPVR